MGHKEDPENMAALAFDAGGQVADAMPEADSLYYTSGGQVTDAMREADSLSDPAGGQVADAMQEAYGRDSLSDPAGGQVADAMQEAYGKDSLSDPAGGKVADAMQEVSDNDASSADEVDEQAGRRSDNAWDPTNIISLAGLQQWPQKFQSMLTLTQRTVCMLLRNMVCPFLLNGPPQSRLLDRLLKNVVRYASISLRGRKGELAEELCYALESKEHSACVWRAEPSASMLNTGSKCCSRKRASFSNSLSSSWSDCEKR